MTIDKVLFRYSIRSLMVNEKYKNKNADKEVA